MKKIKPAPHLPPVIPASKELREAMRRLSQQPPATFEEMKAQTDAMLAMRNSSMPSKSASKSGSARKAA